MNHVNKPSITESGAAKALEAAAAKAREAGVPASIAVCDEAGHLKAFIRMDGSSFAAGKIAEDKAYTAAAFGVPTNQWFSIHESDKALRDGMLTSIDRLSTLGGGVAITAGGAIIGAIGVSGGTYDQDHDAAQAGADAVGTS